MLCDSPLSSWVENISSFSQSTQFNIRSIRLSSTLSSFFLTLSRRFSSLCVKSEMSLKPAIPELPFKVWTLRKIWLIISVSSGFSSNCTISDSRELMISRASSRKISLIPVSPIISLLLAYGFFVIHNHLDLLLFYCDTSLKLCQYLL